MASGDGVDLDFADEGEVVFAVPDGDFGPISHSAGDSHFLLVLATRLTLNTGGVQPGFIKRWALSSAVFMAREGASGRVAREMFVDEGADDARALTSRGAPQD